MQYGFTGDLWHEIAGAVLTIMFIAHVIINRKYYGGMIKKIRSGSKPKAKQIFGFVTDIIFLVGAALMLFSSMVISRNLFIFMDLSFLNYDFWRYVHIFTAIAMLVLGLVHLLLHLNLFKSLFTRGKENKAWNICSKAAAVLMSIAIIPISVRASLSAISGESYTGIKDKEEADNHNEISEESTASVGEGTVTDSFIQSIE